MTALVRRARHAGLRTGLLSNSWGNDYPRDGWDEMFDVVVISGEVGMRKPEPEIFHHTLDLIGLAAAECVFVDDLPHNVAAAVELGMVGVRHRRTTSRRPSSRCSSRSAARLRAPAAGRTARRERVGAAARSVTRCRRRPTETRGGAMCRTG